MSMVFRLSVVWVLLSLNPAVAGKEIAAEAPPAEQFHTIEDYLRWVPEDMASDADLRKWVDEGVSEHSAQYHVVEGIYTTRSAFSSERMTANTVLAVLPDDTAGTDFARAMFKEMESQTKLSGLSLAAIPMPPVDQGVVQAYGIVQADGTIGGNIFMVIQADRVYTVTIHGLGGFDDPEFITEYLGEKSDFARAFQPRLPRIDEEILQIWDGILTKNPLGVWGFLVLYVGLYFVVKGLALLVGKLVPAVAAHRAGIGVCAVVVAAMGLISFTMYTITSQSYFERLEPFTQGELAGKAIATYLVPLFFLAIGLAIAGWMRKPVDHSVQRPRG